MHAEINYISWRRGVLVIQQMRLMSDSETPSSLKVVDGRRCRESTNKQNQRVQSKPFLESKLLMVSVRDKRLVFPHHCEITIIWSR